MAGPEQMLLWAEENDALPRRRHMKRNDAYLYVDK